MLRFLIHHALMHVRWQHRTAYLRNKDQAHWAATLVENVRVGDKMTERYVAYLAGIGERDITRLGAQCGFWERVTRQLDRLSNRISAEDRKRVERVLQERVPCPSPSRIGRGDGSSERGPRRIGQGCCERGDCGRLPRDAATIVRLRSRCGADPDVLLGCIPRGSDHGDRGDRRRARRAPLEDREMSVCSTKTRTAALSVRTRWRPGPWRGSRRPVRSISANSFL